jgi:hypothetical protein
VKIKGLLIKEPVKVCPLTPAQVYYKLQFNAVAGKFKKIVHVKR